MPEDVGRLTVTVLREILKWIKVASIPEAKALLESTLTTSEQRIAYQASDGKNVRQVATIARVSKSSIGRWWAEWVKLGLAELQPAKGGDRAIRAFSLEDFGFDVPKVDLKRPKPK